MSEFKTDYQKEKEEKELQFYTKYQELTANPQNSKMAVMDSLMKEFGIHGYATVYNLLRRVERRIAVKTV